MNPLIHQLPITTFSGNTTITDTNTASAIKTPTPLPLVALIIDTIHYSTVSSDLSLKNTSNITHNQQPNTQNLSSSSNQQHPSSTQVYFILFDSSNSRIHSHREYPIASRSLIDTTTPNSTNLDDFLEIFSEISKILTKKAATNQSVILCASSTLYPFIDLKSLPCSSILHDLEELIFPHADILFKKPMNFQGISPSQSSKSTSSCVQSHQLQTLMHFTSDVPIILSKLFLSLKVPWNTSHNQPKQHQNSHHQIIKSAIKEQIQSLENNTHENKESTRIVPCLETSQNSCTAGINLCCVSTDTDTRSNDIVGDNAESVQILEELQVGEDGIKENKEQNDTSQKCADKEKNECYVEQLSQGQQGLLDTFEGIAVKKQILDAPSEQTHPKSKRISLSVNSKPFRIASSQDNQSISSCKDPKKQLDKYEKIPEILQNKLKNELLLRQHFSIDQLQKVAAVKQFIAIRHNSNQGRIQGLFGSNSFQAYLHGSVISIQGKAGDPNGNMVSCVRRETPELRTFSNIKQQQLFQQQLTGQDCQRQSRSKSKKNRTGIAGRTCVKVTGEERIERQVWRRADTVENRK